MDKDTICTIVEAGDYIHVYCAKCGEPCTMDYKGMGLLVPQLEFICPKCGDLGTFKLDADHGGPGWVENSTI
jgi:hypothetical protein